MEEDHPANDVPDQRRHEHVVQLDVIVVENVPIEMKKVHFLLSDSYFVK